MKLPEWMYETDKKGKQKIAPALKIMVATVCAAVLLLIGCVAILKSVTGKTSQIQEAEAALQETLDNLNKAQTEMQQKSEDIKNVAQVAYESVSNASELSENAKVAAVINKKDKKSIKDRKNTIMRKLDGSDIERPSFIDAKAEDIYDLDFEPCVEPYKVEKNLANVSNLDMFYLSDETQKLLEKNMFAVNGTAGAEFFEVYDSNRYLERPSFITVDSLMHTYHLYFAHLLKQVEKNELMTKLQSMSEAMYDECIAMAEEAEGTEWEEAALINAEFFAVARCLLGDDFDIPDSIAGNVKTEVKRINDASGIAKSTLTGTDEDYTQYIVRGYYEGDEDLEKYFRTMMWYGRINFTQESTVLDRCALLMTICLRDAALEDWEAIYSVTSFFAGAADDNGYYEYLPLINEVYEEDADFDYLMMHEDGFQKFHELTADLKAPQINSIPIWETDETNVIPGFRFMGQRFTIDAQIMQNLIYRNVEETENREKRMLPDTLDVPAVLGSKVALDILKEDGEVEKYPNFMEQFEKLQKGYEKADQSIWSASLYAGWLNTLKPLLEEKGEGYPSFMQSKEWSKKSLETFAGSYAELKHDTILYSKSVMAEMGGPDEDYDDRGYVQPEPLVYARFATLANMTAAGLEGYDMLDEEAEDDLKLLTDIAETLFDISVKELTNELPSDEEFDFIRDYGGNIEHFWLQVAKEGSEEDEYIDAGQLPAAIIADIATDPNGSVLEIGTGNPVSIYVIVPVDGTLRIAEGAAYSFYQFEWPMNERLTDNKWRHMLGIIWTEEEMETWTREEDDEVPDQPEWTQSYRAVENYW